MGINIYYRDVPYSGRAPDAGAARWAAMQSGQMLGNAIKGVGAGLKQFGQRMKEERKAKQEEDLEREARTNALLAETDLDQFARKALQDFQTRVSFTGDIGDSQHHRALEFFENGYTTADGEQVEGYLARRKKWVEAQPKERQDLFLAALQRDPEARWRQAIEERGRDLREEYITNVASAAVRGPGRAGDILAAAARREEVKRLFPEEEWSDIAEAVDTDIALGIARYDPDLARQYAREYLSAAQRKEVGASIEATARAGEAFRKDEFERQQKANERDLAVTVMRRMRGEAVRGAEPADIEYMIEQGMVDPTVGHTWWERVQRPRLEDRNKRMGAYAIISREHARLTRGEITHRRYVSVLNAHGHELAEEDEELWTDRGNAVDDPYKSVRSEATKLAEETLKPLFPAPAAGTRTKDLPPEPAALLSDLALGRIMQQLDQYEAEQVQAGKPLDEAAYRKRANEIIAIVYREEYEAKNPKKGPGLWDKYMSAGTVEQVPAEQGQPTPEELRKQNTREAYEQGKALGYWK